MILVILLSIFSGLTSGYLLLGSTPSTDDPGRFSARILVPALILGLIFYFILIPFESSKTFYYTTGLIPVLFGIHFLGILGRRSSKKDSGIYSDNPLIKVFLLCGNVFVIAVFFTQYETSPFLAGLLFLIFGLAGWSSRYFIKTWFIDKQHENVKEIYEFYEIINGIFLVITGLIVFSGQIMIFEKLIEEIIN